MKEILPLGVLWLSVEGCFRDHSFGILDDEKGTVSQDTLDNIALSKGTLII